MDSVSRRQFVAGVSAGAGLLAGGANAGPKQEQQPKRLPLTFGVAVDEEGVPVVSDGWLQRQVQRMQQLMQPHRMQVALIARRPLPPKFAKLETANDRDALASQLLPKVINAFIVHSLRDVDDPEIMRMGVRWRLRRDVRKDYVIVAASALDTTLCHELGHYFGNGHSQVVNNVMSYRRDGPAAVHFNDKQGARMRQVARRLLALRKLVALPA